MIDSVQISDKYKFDTIIFCVVSGIIKNSGYQITQKKEGKEEYDDIDLGTYIKVLFDNYYSTFILNYGELKQGIGE